MTTEYSTYVLLAIVTLYFLVGTIVQIPSVTTYTAEAQTHGYSLSERLSVIAECESDNTHYDDNGNALRGITGDIGKYQVNPYVWTETAQELGYNLEDEWGNEHMARWIALNDSRGFENWSASYDYQTNECWRDK